MAGMGGGGGREGLGLGHQILLKIEKENQLQSFVRNDRRINIFYCYYTFKKAL